MKPSTPSHRPEPCGTQPTLLVVDDEPGTGLVRAAHLTGLDLRVPTAGTGHEALAFLAVEPVDLLLTDRCMPGMTGAELLDLVPGSRRPGSLPSHHEASRPRCAENSGSPVRV